MQLHFDSVAKGAVGADSYSPSIARYFIESIKPQNMGTGGLQDRLYFVGNGTYQAIDARAAGFPDAIYNAKGERLRTSPIIQEAEPALGLANKLGIQTYLNHPNYSSN